MTGVCICAAKQLTVNLASKQLCHTPEASVLLVSTCLLWTMHGEPAASIRAFYQHLMKTHPFSAQPLSCRRTPEKQCSFVHGAGCVCVCSVCGSWREASLPLSPTDDKSPNLTTVMMLADPVRAVLLGFIVREHAMSALQAACCQLISDKQVSTLIPPQPSLLCEGKLVATSSTHLAPWG